LKEIVLFTAKDCLSCISAKELAKEVARKHKIEVIEISVENLGVPIVVPKTCIAEKIGNRTQIKENSCFTGVGRDYESKLEKLLKGLK